MTWEPCEGKEAGALRSSNKIPNGSISRPSLGHSPTEPETWGPPGWELRLARLRRPLHG
jgi:hypothetical protein